MGNSGKDVGGDLGVRGGEFKSRCLLCGNSAMPFVRQALMIETLTRKKADG
jgi:hypothetical protein